MNGVLRTHSSLFVDVEGNTVVKQIIKKNVSKSINRGNIFKTVLNSILTS